MADKDIIDKIETIRQKFLVLVGIFVGNSPEECPESLQNLLLNSEELKKIASALGEASNSARVRRVCDGKFTCTFVGSSSQGKTTFLSEMFPDLRDRDWLVCDAKDTTSQSLCIEYSPELNTRVTAQSYNYPELVNFINLSRDECENNGVALTFDQLNNRILVDGTKMKVSQSDAAKFKFQRKVDLIPFAGNYDVDESSNRDFIRSLTTKDAIVTTPIINVNNNAYNALQLRALIKNIQLRSNYKRLLELVDNDEGIKRINFIDTPGQGTAAAINKDEIFFYCLGEKSKNIVIQLWRDDELDFIAHFMRCKEQSQFQKLWMEIESQLPAEELRDIEDRLILLMNSARDLCEDTNIKSRYTNPEKFKSGEDQFRLVLKDNALDKMSHKGTLKPAAVCFVDTFYQYGDADNYADAYNRYRPYMEKWIVPDEIGYKTLEEMELINSFKENIESLCKPEDRGHSFFLKKILELVQKNGSKMLVQKHLKRSHIGLLLQKLSDTISFYYSKNGELTSVAATEALENLRKVLNLINYYSYEKFVDKHFKVEQIRLVVDNFLRENPKLTDISELFKILCKNILGIIKRIAKTSSETSEAVTFVEQIMNALYKKNVKLWGYRETTIFEKQQIETSKNLIVYTMQLHAKELLQQIFPINRKYTKDTTIHQTDEDKTKVAALIKTIDNLNKEIQDLYRLHGVN
ncbi:MAG: hypothetical protein LBQ66_14465 [Planctomycetaceae bacterium]|jgi:hypothetical protein|nr:hypothetical protein [Planctomycetaceae bacterium]